MQYSSALSILSTTSNWIFAGMIVAGIAASIGLKKLTVAAAFTGALLSFFIYAGAGLTGIILMSVFFIAGSIATALGLPQKIREGLAEPHKGRRTAGQVFANAGVAAMAGFIHLALPELELNVSLIVAGCFAAATSDTLSSELGNVYGKNFYKVRSLEKGEKGANGVISAEGTLAGLIGSMGIATTYAAVYGFNSSFFIITTAGMAGNIADSLMGDMLENRGLISNNAVNFLNTTVAAIFTLLLNIF